MRPWQFRKPKGPGFGISRAFYLTVLSSRPVLPAVAEVAHPAGKDGAVIGFAVPLGAPAEDKDALLRPMGRGIYAVASKDRKTVLKMLVMSREEAGFDPEPFARSAMAALSEPELVARVRGTWLVAQLTFESHDAAVYPALDFALQVSRRLALLTEGVVADPIGHRFLLPHQVLVENRVDPRIDSRDHLRVHFRSLPSGLHAYTLGMQKLALPELEITGLAPGDEPAAERFLMVLAESVLLGDPLAPGDRAGPFQAALGGLDRGLWEGIPVLELLPDTQVSPSEALRRALPDA